MPIDFRNPDGVAPPVAFYSHLAVVPAGARLLALAGQVGQRPDGSFADGVEAQFEQALANILAIVASEGGDAGSIARLTCFLTERAGNRAALQAIMQRAFPDASPAMTLIYVAGLFAPHVKVEIEALAAVEA